MNCKKIVMPCFFRIHRSMLSTLLRTISSIILSAPGPIEEHFPKSRAVLRSVFGKKIRQASRKWRFRFHPPCRDASCDFSRVCFFFIGEPNINPCPTKVGRSKQKPMRNFCGPLDFSRACFFFIGERTKHNLMPN